MIKRFKKKTDNWFNILNWLLTILDGLIEVITLGYCYGNLSYTHIKGRFKLASDKK